MMPTVHFDAKKAEEATIAFEAVANKLTIDVR